MTTSFPTLVNGYLSLGHQKQLVYAVDIPCEEMHQALALRAPMDKNPYIGRTSKQWNWSGIYVNNFIWNFLLYRTKNYGPKMFKLIF